MLPTPCHVIGDAHLGIAAPEAERDLLAFLRQLPGRTRSLVIMGDLFDFWFAWRHAMPRTGFRVLAALADLRDRDVAVLWLAGNHDCWHGEALEAETGVRFSLEPWRGAIGAWEALLAHGDGLRQVEDAPYRRLRRLLRHPLAIRAFGMLHPDLASSLARRSSHTSRNRRAGDEGRGLRAVAGTVLAAPDAPHLVVHGHSHVPTLEQLGAGWYGNAGAWYLDRQYLRVDDDRIARLAWDGTPEGRVLAEGVRPARPHDALTTATRR